MKLPVISTREGRESLRVKRILRPGSAAGVAGTLAAPGFDTCAMGADTAPGAGDPTAGDGAGEDDTVTDGRRGTDADGTALTPAETAGLAAEAGPEGHPVPALNVAITASGEADFFAGGRTRENLSHRDHKRNPDPSIRITLTKQRDRQARRSRAMSGGF